MKLGFLTACLPDRSLPEIAAWAAGNGFEALEVAAWPDLGARPFTATHLKVDGFGQRAADDVRTLFGQHGLTLSSLAATIASIVPLGSTEAPVPYTRCEGSSTGCHPPSAAGSSR